MVPGRGKRICIPESSEMPIGEHVQGNGRTCAQGKSTRGRLDLPGCDGGYGAHMANLPGPARNSQTNTREGKQTDNGKSAPRRRRGKGQARRTVLLMMVAVMLVEAIAAMARLSEASTHCFQKGSFQTDQEMVREEDSLLIGERRAQVRSEFQEQDTSSLTRWNKNRLQKRHQNAELVRRRSLDRLTNSRRARCVECSASCRLERANVPSVKHSRRQSGDARRARTAYSSAKSAWDMERR